MRWPDARGRVQSWMVLSAFAWEGARCVLRQALDYAASTVPKSLQRPVPGSQAVRCISHHAASLEATGAAALPRVSTGDTPVAAIRCAERCGLSEAFRRLWPAVGLTQSGTSLGRHGMWSETSQLGHAASRTGCIGLGVPRVTCIGPY